jgi:hypothetical protein
MLKTESVPSWEPSAQGAKSCSSFESSASVENEVVTKGLPWPSSLTDTDTETGFSCRRVMMLDNNAMK